jgi:DUF3025 family protein
MFAGAGWNARFFEADSRFWPIEPAARRFADHADWPAPEELQAPGVRFVTAPKPRRARRRPQPSGAGYDARVLSGEVPTRPRSWHDFLNALVWATFPASKHALHARQARAIRASLPDGARTLPNARSREHDALALLDEGGVIVLETPQASLALGFGHALYEGVVVGGPSATASGLAFPVSSLPSRADAPKLADRLLAERLDGELLPEMLLRRAF